MNPLHLGSRNPQRTGTRSGLSIVIPAYKSAFIGDALASLAEQTDQGFEVVVADDASPSDIGTICRRYMDRLTIRHVRFPSNVGRQDLALHWSRAVDAATNDWIWLMGDDDELEPGCVAAVRAAIEERPDWTGLWRVNVTRIDANAAVIAVHRDWPEVVDGASFLLARCRGAISSYACEYVFRRSTLRARGGFVSFPLGWCSDDATWLRLAAHAGIRTASAPRARARWRLSTLNISGAGPAHEARKLEARLRYIEWLGDAGTRRALGIDSIDRATIDAALLEWFTSAFKGAPCRLTWAALMDCAGRLADGTRSSRGSNALRLLPYWAGWPTAVRR